MSRYLVEQEQVPGGLGVLQQVEGSLTNDQRVEQTHSVWSKWNVIRNLLPEEDPVPDRLQMQQSGC